MDARGVLLLLYGRRIWILVCIIVCALLFAAVAFLSAPRYRASTVIIAANTSRSVGLGSLTSNLGELGGLASLAGLNIGNENSETEEALGVLRSRAFTQDFIQRENLLPILFAKRWDASRGTWKVPPKQQPTLEKAFKYFDKGIRTINEDRKTNLITLQIEWRDPVQAADWANSMISQLNAKMRSRAITMADASIGYLESAYKSTTLVATQQAISQLLEAQVRQRMVATVTPEYAFRVVSPALPSDRDAPVWPRKLLLLAAGPAVGFLLGIFSVLTYEALFGELARVPRPVTLPGVRDGTAG